jgi:hypothetical protein
MTNCFELVSQPRMIRALCNHFLLLAGGRFVTAHLGFTAFSFPLIESVRETG